jgi:hypothetical protein
MGSKLLSRDEGQDELPLARSAAANDVPIELVRRQKTANAALCLACQSSGLEDKDIYLTLKIDPGYWSRIKKGEASLQADLIELFCDVVKNRIYPEWIAYRVGCTLVQIQTEAERRAEAAEERAQSAEAKVRVLMEALAGKVTS